MPLFKKTETPASTLALWRITEDIAFFESKFSAHPEIKNEGKKLQWFATRHLLNELFGEPVTISKDEAGKPFLDTAEKHISISHTPEFAAVTVSHTNAGVDLEMVNPKVERIAHKFLEEEEITSISPEEKIEKLILYWSAKEALYKLYGKGQIEFRTQLLIEPFQLNLKGELKANILVREGGYNNLLINYEFFHDHVVSWVSL